MPKDKDKNTMFDRAARRAAAIRVGKEGGLANLGHGATMLGALIREAISPTTPPSREQIRAAHSRALKASAERKSATAKKNEAQRAKGFKKNLSEVGEALTTPAKATAKIPGKLKSNLEGVRKKAKRASEE